MIAKTFLNLLSGIAKSFAELIGKENDNHDAEGKFCEAGEAVTVSTPDGPQPAQSIQKPVNPPSTAAGKAGLDIKISPDMEKRAEPYTKPFKVTDGGKERKVDPYGENNFEVVFDEVNLNNHFTQHSKEYNADGGITRQEMSKHAGKLIQSPVGGDIVGYARTDGTIVRYNKSTNEYAVGKPWVGVRTFMRPRYGKSYYDDDFRKEFSAKEYIHGNSAKGTKGGWKK